MAAAARAAPATESVTAQVDSAHDGYVYGAGVVPPLKYAWSINLGGEFNPYVAIDGGRAYALSGGTSAAVKAIDLATGRVLWSQPMSNKGAINYGMYLTVDNGKVFTADSGTWPQGSAASAVILSAYDESSGALLWSDPLSEQPFPTAPLTSGGVLYLEGYGGGADQYAISESDGARLWTTSLGTGNNLTLAGNTLVDSGECGVAYGLNAGSGSELWRHYEGCSGGSSPMSSFDGNSVWGDDVSNRAPGRVYDPAHGDVLTRFSGYAPSFGYGEAVQAVFDPSHDLTVNAFDPNTKQSYWSFPEKDGTASRYGTPILGSAPLLADGYVFAQGGQGTVWAFNPLTGAVVWQYNTGQTSVSQGIDQLPSMSAGDGYLIAPTSTGLVAFRGSGFPSAPAPSQQPAVGQPAPFSGSSPSATAPAPGPQGPATPTGASGAPVASAPAGPSRAAATTHGVVASCVVPALRRLTLAQARRALARAHCSAARLHAAAFRRGAIVARQSPAVQLWLVPARR